MRYIVNKNTDAHYNMAFDQFCLEGLPLDEPLFYLWRNGPAVIIGLNQNPYTEVNIPYLESHGIKLARRVTGGGAVYHDLQNLNYTIVGRTDDLERHYPDYTHLIADALVEMGVPAEVSGRNDILVEGHKVSGYAKRCWKDRTMIHGTLMYDVDIETLSDVLAVNADKLQVHGISSVKSRVANLKDYMPNVASVEELYRALEDILSLHYRDTEIVLSQGQLAAIESMAHERYRTWEWNYGHSPSATLVRKQRFGCGSIEVHVNIEKGRIMALHFIGDFIGRMPVSTLSERLVGIQFDRPSVIAALNGIHIDDWFDDLTLQQFIGLLLG